MVGLSSHLYLFCRLSWKVKSINLFCKLIYLFRVLIATICNKGGCLCPQCLIPKQYLLGLGTTSDTKLHSKQLCSDTIQCQGKIIQAHDFIYNKGYVVSSKNVDNLFKEGSYVPTEVSSCFQYDFQLMDSSTFSEHVFVMIGWSQWWIRFFHSVGCWSDAWVQGRSLESTADSPDTNSTHPRWKHSDRIQWPVINHY